MSTPESPGIPAPPAPIPGAVGPAASDAMPRYPAAGRVWAVTLLAGLVGGLAAWGVGEFQYPYFSQAIAAPSMGITPEQIAAQAYNRVAEFKNTVIYYGRVGALLGLAFGLAGGLARTLLRPMAISGVLGLVLGGAAGALSSLAIVMIRDRYPLTDPNDLVNSSLNLCGIWGPIGLASGLALGAGLGRRGRIAGAALSGLVGALLGTGLYPIVVSAFTPTLPTTGVVGASSTARLVGALVLALCAAVAAARGATTGPSKKVPAIPPPAA